MKLSQSITPFIVALGVTFTGTAMAHGSKAGHAEKKPMQAVEKEQTAWGIAGDAAAASRTVRVAMSDKMRFTPSSIQVKEGETVKFLIENKGQILHEFVLGNQKSLDEHAAMMIKFPHMEHDEPYQAHVAPGKTGELVWQFNRGGDFKFACLIPGHYQAGMVGTLGVNGMGKGHGHAVKKPHGHAKKAMNHDDGHADGKQKKHTH